MGSTAEQLPVGQNGLGWYVYGVVGATGAPGELAAGTAVDSAHEVTLLREGTLAAVASKVSLQEFTEGNLREALTDPAWLEPRIRAHEQVLEAALAVGSVVPFRFCTLFESEDALRRFLAERTDELQDALRHVGGKIEVGVKGFVAHKRLADALAERHDAVRELKDRVAVAHGGREYLERRRLERLVAEETERFKAETARELHARLRSAADDGVLNPVQSREATGRRDDMFMNGAYLVGRGSAFEREVGALAAEYADLGVILEATGPWPPYNFVPQALGES